MGAVTNITPGNVGTVSVVPLANINDVVIAEGNDTAETVLVALAVSKKNVYRSKNYDKKMLCPWKG